MPHCPSRAGEHFIAWFNGGNCQWLMIKGKKMVLGWSETSVEGFLTVWGWGRLVNQNNEPRWVNPKYVHQSKMQCLFRLFIPFLTFAFTDEGEAMPFWNIFDSLSWFWTGKQEQMSPRSQLPTLKEFPPCYQYAQFFFWKTAFFIYPFEIFFF